MFSRSMASVVRLVALISVIVMSQTGAFGDGSAQLSGSASGGGCAGSVCSTSQFYLASQTPITIPTQSGSAAQSGVSASGSAVGHSCIRLFKRICRRGRWRRRRRKRIRTVHRGLGRHAEHSFYDPPRRYNCRLTFHIIG